MKSMLDELQGLSLSVVEQFNQSHWAAEDLSANDAHGLSDVSRAFCERFVWRLRRQGIDVDPFYLGVLQDFESAACEG